MKILDSRFHGNDRVWGFQTFYDLIMVYPRYKSSLSYAMLLLPFPDSYNMNKYFLTIYFRLTKGITESSHRGLDDPGFLTIGRVLDYE